MNSNQLDLTLVLACFNEEPHLLESFREIVSVLSSSRLTAEVLLIDDLSTDGTRSVIDHIVSTDWGLDVRRIFHSENLGRGGTVTEGFKLGRGRVVGFIDVDLEVSPLYITALTHHVLRGADVATGFRHYRLKAGLVHRAVMSRCYSALVRSVLDVRLQDTETGFKFFNRERILPILEMVRDTRWFWDTEIMVRSVRAGLSVVEVPCVFVRRPEKKSTVRLWNDSVTQMKRLFEFREQLSLENRDTSGPILSDEAHAAP